MEKNENSSFHGSRILLRRGHPELPPIKTHHSDLITATAMEQSQHEYSSKLHLGMGNVATSTSEKATPVLTNIPSTATKQSTIFKFLQRQGSKKSEPISKPKRGPGRPPKVVTSPRIKLTGKDNRGGHNKGQSKKKNKSNPIIANSTANSFLFSSPTTIKG